MIAWIKEHPYLAGALGVALLLLYIVVRNRNSASASTAAQTVTGGTDPSLQALAIQSGTSLANAQYQANAQVTQLSAQLQGEQLSLASSDYQARLGQQVQLQQLADQTGLGTLQITDTLGAGGIQQTQLADTTNVQLQTLADQLTLGLATLARGTTPTLATAVTPAAVAAVNPNTSINAGQVTTSAIIGGVINDPGIGTPNGSGTPNCSAGMHYAAGACIYDADPTSVSSEWQVSQTNDAIWNAASQKQCIPQWWVNMNGNQNGSPVC